MNVWKEIIHHPFEYERFYLPLYEVADTTFNIQGDKMCS